MLSPAPRSLSLLFFFNGGLLLRWAVSGLRCGRRALWLRLQVQGLQLRLRCPAAGGIAVPGAGMEPRALRWRQVLHPRTPRKFLPALCPCLCLDGMRNSMPLGETVWAIN